MRDKALKTVGLCALCAACAVVSLANEFIAIAVILIGGHY